MGRDYMFKLDQTVKLWDGFTDSYHYGTVMGSGKRFVEIKWFGIDDHNTYSPGEINKVWEEMKVIKSKN